MDIRTRLDKLVSKTFISGIVGLFLMAIEPAIAVYVVEIVAIIAGHHIAKGFFDMKKALK